MSFRLKPTVRTDRNGPWRSSARRPRRPPGQPQHAARAARSHRQRGKQDRVNEEGVVGLTASRCLALSPALSDLLLQPLSFKTCSPPLPEKGAQASHPSDHTTLLRVMAIIVDSHPLSPSHGRPTWASPSRSKSSTHQHLPQPP